MKPYLRTIYSHGLEFWSCAICDKELTINDPGQRVMYIQKGVRYIEFVCNDCFGEPDYQDIIKDTSNKFGMDVRSFPQMQD